MVSESTRKTLILSVSAIVGATTVSAIAYWLIQDDRKAKHLRKIRTLQKSLCHKLVKIDNSVQEIVDGDIRLAKVRSRTLRTYPIYPNDPSVSLPRLGLINEQDKIQGEVIEETQEELIHERTQGYGEDTQVVRKAYKRLDFLISSINERLLRFLESLDAIFPRELTDLGDGFGGIPLLNGPEIQAFEKVRRRKKAIIEKIQKIMQQVDGVGASIKDRVVAVETFERNEAEKAIAEAAATTAQKGEEAKADNQKANGNTAEVKGGLSFADVAKQNTPKIEVLEQTRDLERMKEGQTFAEVASANTHHEESENNSKTEVLEQTQDLEKMKEGHTFAEVASTNTHYEQSDSSSTTSVKSTITTTSSKSITVNGSTSVSENNHVEKAVNGVSFAEVAASGLDKNEIESDAVDIKVLEPLEDLEKLKNGIAPSTDKGVEKDEETKASAVVDGVSFAEVASVN